MLEAGVLLAIQQLLAHVQEVEVVGPVLVPTLSYPVVVVLYPAMQDLEAAVMPAH
jgi:hypothetical protein